jgi:tetratricopeptide (TPR) repeat protein
MIPGIRELGRDNDERLRRLRTALTLDSGFQLVLVEAEPGPIRREVIRRIETWSTHGSIGPLATMTLAPEMTLQVQLARKRGAIVTGLEPPSPTGTSPRDWVAELNWLRDLLPELVPGPFVLVVSQAMHRALFERAPDLYSWRIHTTRVTLTARELARPLSSPRDRFWLGERERISHLLSLPQAPSSLLVTRLNLADTLLQLGDWEGASRVLGTVPSLRGREPLLRGKLHAAGGAWDAARMELEQALASARGSSPRELASALEGLAQVELARGDIIRARSEISQVIEIAGAHSDRWGVGMMLRIAAAAGDIYPDEIAPLLDAALAGAERLSWREDVISIRLERAKRAWLLDRSELMREEIARAKELIAPEDQGEMHGLVHLYEAAAARIEGSGSEEDLTERLTRAGELLRATAPRQAALAGGLLGDLHASRRRDEPAIAAYRTAAEDARAAADHDLAADAELAALGAAVEGELDDELALEQLRTLARRFQAAGHALREGIACAHLGRCLLRRRRTIDAAAELKSARACFEATTDAAREREVARLLEAVP